MSVRIRAVSAYTHDVADLGATAGANLREVLLACISEDVFCVTTAECSVGWDAKDVGRVLVGKIDALEAIRAVVVGLLTEAMLTEILEVRGGLSRTLGRRCSVL
ncbi:MAG: hypothetical protein U0I01_02105 [Pauljensenia sp.]|nr:hypothetical protein [Pauljensenia sp.]